MRRYSFILLCLFLLVGVTLVVGRTNEPTNEDDGEYVEEDEEQSLSTTKAPPKRMKKKPKPKVMDHESPECQRDTIDGQPAYMCERTIDGEKKKFGIKFDESHALYCGEFEDNQLNGHGFRFYTGEKEPQRMICGNFAQDVFDGLTNIYFFDQRAMEMSNSRKNYRQGFGVSYFFDINEYYKLWYKSDVCRSVIRYNRNGDEYYRNPIGCA